jgi:Trk-type K+ transport system membrane component
MDDLEASGATPASVKVCRQGLHPLFALLSAFCLLALVGWTGVVTGWQHWITTLTGIVFAFERGWVFHQMRADRAERRRLGGHAVLAAVVLVVALVLLAGGGRSIAGHVFIQVAVLASGVASAIHHQPRLTARAFHPGLVLILSFLAIIVVLTFACEAVGAVILYAGMDAIADPGERWFHAVFHSVSAFCNAGFSTLPDGLASTIVQGNGLWQIVIMALIVIGGIGALVCEDLVLWSLAKIRRHRLKEGPNPRLRVHTRLVLLVTAALIVGGAVAIYLTEFVLWQGPENGGSLLTALFHSVTTRTAGFNTVSMSAIGPLTAQLMMLLMLVGGSPGGTAGGLRTTTVAVGLGHLWNQLRGGQRGMVAFNRTIPAATGARALGLIVLAGLWLIANFIILQMLESGRGIAESTLLFELISAFATVGLSLDLTPLLTDGSKSLLIVNMFVGRIGLLTVMATFIPPDRRPASGRPSEDILLT